MTSHRVYVSLCCLLAFLVVTAHVSPASAKGPLRTWLEKRREQRGQDTETPGENNGYGGLSCKNLVRITDRFGERPMQKASGPLPEPAGTFSYGKTKAQSLDVYTPGNKAGGKHAPAPVIFMVHGGAWCVGDKAAAKITVNKVARWVSKGFIFVSANYRMVPDGADPAVQADDVAEALAYVQEHAAQWGGDPDKIIIMGHSAGAHLVSLLSADPNLASGHGVRPWLGTVSLDSGAMDVAPIMQAKHYPFYDDAFGKDEAYWTEVSPFARLSSRSLPWLGVCSTQREISCPQAHAFANKAAGLGVRAAVLEENLKHDEINDYLGKEGGYTSAVEEFMGALDGAVKARLE